MKSWRTKLSVCAVNLMLVIQLVSATEISPQEGNAKEHNEALGPEECLQYAEFRQEKYLTGLPKPLVTRGKVILDCKRGTVWSTEWPIREIIVYQMSGKQWIIKAETDKQEIKNSVQKRVGNIVAQIMRGDEGFIDKYFKRETTGQATRLVPTQKRLKKYIESIDLQPAASGMLVDVRRVDDQDMRLELFGVRALEKLDAEDCLTLLQSQLGCELLFEISGK